MLHMRRPSTAAPPYTLHTHPTGGFFDGRTTAEERQRYLLETIRTSAQVGALYFWPWLRMLVECHAFAGM